MLSGGEAALIGGAFGGDIGAVTGLNEDLYNRQLHQTERDWAKRKSGEYQKALLDKTGEAISVEEAYRRLLSAGYAIVDMLPSKVVKVTNSPSNLSQPTQLATCLKLLLLSGPAFLNGNLNGSWTPEQQARYGVNVPAAPADNRSAYDRFSTSAHLGLSTLGVVPFFGAVPDILDLGLRAAEIPFGKSNGTDLGFAGIGVLATVAPGLGDGVAATAKITKRLEKQSEVIAEGASGAGRTFLSADELAKLPKTGTIDPSLIRFSQDSAKANFKPPYGSVDDFILGLRNGTVDVTLVAPIRIVNKDGQIFTLDNRRLFSFQQAQVPIPYNALDTIPKSQLFKFTTENEGVSIMIRKGDK